MSLKAYIIAGEASGDLHASNLAKALKKESDINNINEFVEYFFCTYRNFYYYIDKFNAYYEYHETGNLILINSDKIFF